MRKSQLQNRYAKAQALFAQGKLTEAALMYEQALQAPFGKFIKRDIHLRIKSACFVQLAEVIIESVSYKSNNIELINKLIALFNDALIWSQQIQKPLKIDYLNRANTLVKLAIMHLGCDLLDDSIKSHYFNIKTVIELSRQIQANYDFIKTSLELRSLDQLRTDLAKLYHAVASFLFNMFKKDNEKTNADVDPQKDRLMELKDINEPKKFMLAAIAVLNEAHESEYDDEYWKIRLSVERFAVELYSCMRLDDDELTYYQLIIQHCKKIKQLTVEDLFFEDTTYTEYSDILKDTGELECINLAIKINIEAIERYALLFEVIKEPEFIEFLYFCISNRFKILSEIFSQSYGINSLGVKISKFAQLCYQNISDDFNPHVIEYFNEELLFHCLNFNCNRASKVHALNCKLLLCLVGRDDFPNKILKNFLSNEQNILLFQTAKEPIILQRAEIIKVERLDVGSEVTAEPIAAIDSSKPDEPCEDFRKRKEFTYKEDQISLLSPHTGDKKMRTDTLAVVPETNLRRIG